MRSEPRFVALAEIAANVPNATAAGPFGSNLVSKDYVESGIPVIRGQNLAGRWVEGDFVYVSAQKAEQLRTNTTRPGDIVFTQRGTLGQVSLVPQQPFPLYVVSQSQMKLTVDVTKADPRFVYYACTSSDFVAQVHNNAVAAGVPHINLGILRSLEIPLPPRWQQSEVANVLSLVDDRIDLLRQTNTTLESFAQALFKSWFIDFDPVRAKAEGREPEGMDAATAALFPGEFEESMLGVVPRGWQPSAIRDVVEGVYDGPHATPPEASAGPVFLGIKNLTGSSLDLSEIRHVDERDWERWTRRVTPAANDIVFSYEAALGLFALVPPHLRCCLGRRLALVRANARDGTPHFWFHQFVAAPFQQLLAKHTVHGATVNRIALKEFPSYKVLNPPVFVRTAFEQAAAPLWARIHSNGQLVQVLSSLRDALLPRLISGKLRLPEVQEQFEEAAA